MHTYMDHEAYTTRLLVLFRTFNDARGPWVVSLEYDLPWQRLTVKLTTPGAYAITFATLVAVRELEQVSHLKAKDVSRGYLIWDIPRGTALRNQLQKFYDDGKRVFGLHQFLKLTGRNLEIIA